MKFLIRNYEQKDEDQLKALLRICFEDEYCLNIIKSTNLRFAYSALLGDKLIAIMFAWANGSHPCCTYFRILCNPLFNTLNIEEELLSKVSINEAIKYPLQTSFWESSTYLTSLYEKNRFSEIRRTYMPTLNIASISEEFFHNDGQLVATTLEQIISVDMLYEKLALAVKTNYEKSHSVNPVAKKSLNEWKTMILANDIVLSGSLVHLNQEGSEIIAYSFLHEADNTDTIELGWCGTTANQNIRLVPQLVMRQIIYARQHGFQFIAGEFDTTDVFSMEVLNSFPFAPCPAWITYQKHK